MATIPGVSDNELIRTSWGDAVADELNANTVKLTGTQTISGPKTFTATTTTMDGQLLLPVTQSVHAQAAVHRTWVDTTFVRLDGDTMTGPLLLDADPLEAWAACRKFYVDNEVATRLGAAGGTMTGVLFINPASGDRCISLRSADPYIDFYNEAATTRYGQLIGDAFGLKLSADGSSLRFLTDGFERGRFQATILLVGKQSAGTAAAGVELWGGEGRGVITGDTNNPNLILNAIAAGAVTGHDYIRFEETGTTVGTVKRTAGGVAYNTTSDYRLKDELGPVVDPVGKMMALQPKHLRWKVDDLSEFDGFLAHEVQAVVPAAVTGVKDAVHPPDHDSTPGAIDPQQLDTAKLIPLLTAALQDAHTKISELTARVAALEAA